MGGAALRILFLLSAITLSLPAHGSCRDSLEGVGQLGANLSHLNSTSNLYIGFDKRAHPFLIHGSDIFHARLFFKKNSLKKRGSKPIRAAYAIELQDVSEAAKSNLAKELETLCGGRSLTCVDGLARALEKGAGMQISGGNLLSKIDPYEFIEALERGELKYLDGTPVTLSFIEDNLKLNDLKQRAKLLRAAGVLALPIFKMFGRFISPRDYDIHSETASGVMQELYLAKAAFQLRRGWNLLHSTLHNAWQAERIITRLDKESKLVEKFPAPLRFSLRALLKIAGKPMAPNLIASDHPWVTGIEPKTGEFIWPKNIVYASARTKVLSDSESDGEIVNKVGHFLGSMARKSTGEDVLPQGPQRRMPHIVNYLHGAVQYNGAFIIFNDFSDAILHLTSPNFIRDWKEFVKREKREIMLVIRERNYKEEDFAYFLGVVRSALPWFANANGPKKRVLWGTASPYPVVNVINGHYFDDIKNLESGNSEALVRPPLEAGKYFKNSPYNGFTHHTGAFDRWFAYWNYKNIKRRGFQSNLVFTPRDLIEPQRKVQYDSGKPIEFIAPIPRPNSQKSD